MNTLYNNNNVNTNHPLITNSQEYAMIKKYVSVHSEDRDFNKYPNASEFEITLPEDLLNISSMKLSDWSFPTSYDTYTELTGNIQMTFKINKPLDPSTIVPVPADIVLLTQIYEALVSNKENNYTIIIEEGIYSGPQLANELTNKFNKVVKIFLKAYLDANYPGNTFTSYNEFVVFYNLVTQIMSFGNKSSGFILTNSTQVAFNYSPSQPDCNNCKSSISKVYSTLPRSANVSDVNCNRTNLPDAYDYGLPYYLGLLPCDAESIESTDSLYIYYDSPLTAWLSPTYPGTSVHYVVAVKKTILNSQVYFYLELAGYNCIDETSPYSISHYTLTTNGNNGVANSAFAKINAVANLTGSYLEKSPAYKFFMPPAERIRKLKIKCRYHSGQLVEFKGLPYSLLFEFVLLTPQQIRGQKVYNPQYGGK